MMYPKQRKRKKRKKHKPSILHYKDGTCYLCAKLEGLYYEYPVVHEHHVYPGNPNRQISEANGFKVYLCPAHHEFSKAAVHENHENMRLIQRDCQREYERTHTREEFMELIGRNYLLDDEEEVEEAHAETEPGFILLVDELGDENL